MNCKYEIHNLKITKKIKIAGSEYAFSHVFDNGLPRRELFPLRLSQIMPSYPKVSLHCMSCKENHPHLYVLHKEKTSEQMQQQEIDCYGRNQKYPCLHWALFYGGQQKEIWQQTGRLGQDTYSITTRIGQFRIHQSTTICSNQDNIISYSSEIEKKNLKPNLILGFPIRISIAHMLQCSRDTQNNIKLEFHFQVILL